MTPGLTKSRQAEKLFFLSFLPLISLTCQTTARILPDTRNVFERQAQQFRDFGIFQRGIGGNFPQLARLQAHRSCQGRPACDIESH